MRKAGENVVWSCNKPLKSGTNRVKGGRVMQEALKKLFTDYYQDVYVYLYSL